MSHENSCSSSDDVLIAIIGNDNDNSNSNSFTYISSGSSNTTLDNSDTTVGSSISIVTNTEISLLIPRTESNTETPILCIPNSNDTFSTLPPTYISSSSLSNPPSFSTATSSSLALVMADTPVPTPSYISIIQPFDMPPATPPPLSISSSLQPPQYLFGGRGGSRPRNQENVLKSFSSSKPVLSSHPWGQGRLLPTQKVGPLRCLVMLIQKELDPQGFHYCLLLSTIVLLFMFLVYSIFSVSCVPLLEMSTSPLVDSTTTFKNIMARLCRLLVIVTVPLFLAYLLTGISLKLARFATHQTLHRLFRNVHAPPKFDYCLICNYNYKKSEIVGSARSKIERQAAMLAFHQAHMDDHLQARYRALGKDIYALFKHRPFTAGDFIGSVVLIVFLFLVAYIAVVGLQFPSNAPANLNFRVTNMTSNESAGV